MRPHVAVVSDLGYSVIHSDSNAFVLSFNTGRSFKTWAGQDLTATMFTDRNGTRVVVGGSLAKGGNPFGGGQIAAWGEKNALSRRFLDVLAQVLPTVPEPEIAHLVPPAVVRPPTIAEQLQHLADLHRSGALNDAEFAGAKSRLVG